MDALIEERCGDVLRDVAVREDGDREACESF